LFNSWVLNVSASFNVITKFPIVLLIVEIIAKCRFKEY